MELVEETINQKLIEQLQRRIRELKHQNRQYFEMLENSYDGLLIADATSRILYINPSIERIMGLKYPDSIGRTTRELVEEGITNASAAMEVIESGKKETVLINTALGKTALSTGVPSHDRNGKIHRIYCNIRDITDLNQLKEKYMQSQVVAAKYLAELNELKKNNNAVIIAQSEEMLKVIDLAYRIAYVDSTVLLLGESGVGKDLIAKVIHNVSPRNEAGLFLKINCGAIPENLLESELFGYETGAFTGANKEGKAGYFEFVNKGTLFLDEIGDLPMKLQVKLLNVIQDQKVTRVGGFKPKEIDVRILAATNKNLEEMVKQGLFREDLFYRLNVLPIMIPPLRERKDDVLLLIQHYAEHFNKKYNFNVRFSKEAIQTLSKYDWPGNVRELANVVERLIIIAQETIITPEHIPPKYHQACVPGTIEPDYQIKTLKNAVEQFENKLIDQTIKHCGSREEAAVQLDISISSLTRKIKRLRRSKQTRQ